MSTWAVHHGEIPAALDELEAESVHAVVCDPPYELGFMGRSWDNSGVAFRPETWAGVLRVLKPGGHLIAFGGSRTYHRIACAIEDAGFDLRDTLMWLYASGFPKSLNVSKAIDRSNGDEREPDEYSGPNHLNGVYGKAMGGGVTTRRASAASAASAAWDGWGTALKPAFEPIILARKPLGGTVAATALKHGTGALNVDGCRIPDDGEERAARFNNVTLGSSSGGVLAAGAPVTVEQHPLGRWPANVLHDNSADVRLHLGDARRFFFSPKASTADREEGTEELEVGTLSRVNSGGLENDPKWAPRQRKNTHVTVKPSGLMEWLVRLVTPPGGTVLDPFTGSGTTGVAALRQGFNFVGFEMMEEHVKIARARVGWAALHPLDRAAKSADKEQGTLFGKPQEDSEDDPGKDIPW